MSAANNAKLNSQALRDKLNQSLKQRLSRRNDAGTTGTSVPKAEEDANNRQTTSTQRSKQFMEDIENEALHEVGMLDSLNLLSGDKTSPAPPETPKAAEQAAPSPRKSSAELRAIEEAKAAAERKSSDAKNEAEARSSAMASALASANSQGFYEKADPAKNKPVLISHEPDLSETNTETLTQTQADEANAKTTRIKAAAEEKAHANSATTINPPPSADEVPDEKKNPSIKGTDMTEEEKPEQSSLMDILKSSKSDSVKTGSSLKAPRQSAQHSGNSAPEPEAEQAATNQPKKDTYLKSPTRNRPPQSQVDSQKQKEAQNTPKSHEKEVFDAIARGDAEWISNTSMAGITPSRQEMLLIFSMSQPDCINALFSAGIEFNRKDGMALKTAIAKKHFAALEILKVKGARIDLDTLRRVNAWRRTQPRMQTGTKNQDQHSSIVNPEKIQADFEQFLTDHATELDTEDLRAFATPPSPTPNANPADESFMVGEHVYEQTANNDSIPETVIDNSPELNDFTSLSFEENQPEVNAVKNKVTPQHLEQDSEPDPKHGQDILHYTENQDLEPFSPAEDNLNPLPENTPIPSTETTPTQPPSPPLTEHAMTSPSPTTGQAPADRKHPASLGSSTKDAARLLMLDKVLLEKQTLEMRVIELEMYEEAATSLEDERNKLVEELTDNQDAIELLKEELAEMKTSYQNYETIKNGLKNDLANAKSEIQTQIEKNKRDKELHAASSINSASQLKDAERREVDLKTANDMLSRKIVELENRKVPAPKVDDWLKGTEKEAALRKNMFISSVINGEVNLLKKVASNTGADSELAHIALVFAAETGQVKCAQWLVDNMDVHPGFGGEIALLRAIEHGQSDMVRWLSAHGSDIHHAEEFALRLAAHKDDAGLLDLLIELGAKPRAASERALREAAEECSWSCFKALLVYGCTGYDDKGDLYSELSEQEECKEHLAWIAQQRKLAKTLDPEFAKRAGRNSH